MCGGTWFRDGNQSHILTAAHCVKSDGAYLANYLV